MQSASQLVQEDAFSPLSLESPVNRIILFSWICWRFSVRRPPKRKYVRNTPSPQPSHRPKNCSWSRILPSLPDRCNRKVLDHSCSIFFRLPRVVYRQHILLSTIKTETRPSASSHHPHKVSFFVLSSPSALWTVLHD